VERKKVAYIITEPNSNAFVALNQTTSVILNEEPSLVGTDDAGC